MVRRFALAALLLTGLALPVHAHAPQHLVYAGARGAEVLSIQRALGGHGLTLETDGRFGPATRAAVMRFQKRAGLGKIDGIVGPETRAALAAVVRAAAPRPADTPPPVDTLRASWKGETRDYIYLSDDGETRLLQRQQHDGEAWRNIGEPTPYRAPWLR